MNENKNDALNIFNNPIPTENPQEEQPVVEETPVEETSVEDQPVVEDATPVEEAPVQEEDQVITSGTATEEEIEIDASKPEEEVLDEEEIVKDVKEEKAKSKHGLLFIIFIFAIVIAFVWFLPEIIKTIGLG